MTGLFLVDVDGKNLRPLFKDPTLFSMGPAWSPDGKQIVFAGVDLKVENSRAIYVANMDGSDVRALTDYKTIPDPSSPVWSPNGKQIAFTTKDGVYLMNADGSDEHLLVRIARPVDLFWGQISEDLLVKLPLQPPVPLPTPRPSVTPKPSAMPKS